MKQIHYLNNTVFCKLGASKIHGVGVFAIRDIPKGTQLTDNKIWDRNKRKNYYNITAEEFKTILPEIQGLILDRMQFIKGQDLEFISPNDDQVLQSFMNHSDDPNSDGEYAIKDIKCGEEITEDFTKLVDDPHELSINHDKQFIC